MIEVEIRAKVTSFSQARKALKKLGFVKTKDEIQVDIIFGREEDLDNEHKIIDGRFIARIRQRNDQKSLEWKEILRKGSALELSVPLTNPKDGYRLLTCLGYRESFTITKNREIYEHNKITVCLDSIDKLGKYIEIEKEAASERDAENRLAECQSLLAQIDPTAISEPKKYGDLMQELINRKCAS